MIHEKFSSMDNTPKLPRGVDAWRSRPQGRPKRRFENKLQRCSLFRLIVSLRSILRSCRPANCRPYTLLYSFFSIPVIVFFSVRIPSRGSSVFRSRSTVIDWLRGTLALLLFFAILSLVNPNQLIPFFFQPHGSVRREHLYET